MLVAIAIPVFTTQLEKSREATDLANIRSAYAEVMSAYLAGDTSTTATVELKQTQSGWQSVDTPVYVGTAITAGSNTTGQVEITGTPAKGGKCTLSVDDTTGTVTINCA